MTAAVVSAKTCRCCRHLRPAAQFFPSRFTADGLTDRCKPCVFQQARLDRAEREARAQRRALENQRA